MMFRNCLKSTVGLIALVAAGPVWAADVLPPPPAPSVEVADHSSSASCMYVRADVGGVFHERPSVTKAAVGPGGAFAGGLEAIGESIEDAMLFEAGVGCQLLENFRVEAVVGARLGGQFATADEIVHRAQPHGDDDLVTSLLAWGVSFWG